MFEQLSYGLDRLNPISKKAATEYSHKASFLLDRVNQNLANNDEINDLLGDNSLNLMYENHKNHLRFMKNLFVINDFELLAKTVAWVYKSYHKRGFDYRYFVIEYQIWQEAVKQELSQESAKLINQVYQWLLKNHQDFIKISQQLTRERYAIADEWKDSYQKFLDLLLLGDDQKCMEFANQVVSSEQELKKFFLEVIQPAMYTIGSLWEEGEISVASEHLASSIVARIVSSLYAKFLSLEQDKGQAIISAGPNEYHELGARMVADLLELDGWDIDYLGANTPTETLVEMIKEKKPFFVGLSASLSFNLEALSNSIEKIRNSAEIKNTKILVGGNVFNKNPNLWKKLAADAWAKDGQEAIKIARKWWQENETS